MESLASKVEAAIQSSDAMKVSVRVHLFTLLCEEMKIACARQLEDKDLVLKMIRLLSSGQQVFAARMKANDGAEIKSTDAATTPKLMAPFSPLLLLLEFLSCCEFMRKCL